MTLSAMEQAEHEGMDEFERYKRAHMSYPRDGQGVHGALLDFEYCFPKIEAIDHDGNLCVPAELIPNFIASYPYKDRVEVITLPRGCDNVREILQSCNALPNLRKIGTGIMPNELDALPPHVESVGLLCHGLTPQSAEGFPEGLKELVLFCAPGYGRSVHDEFIEALSRRCPGFVFIRLRSYCSRLLGDRALTALQSLRKLQVLHVSGNDRFSEAGLIRFFRSPAMKNLKEVSMCYCLNFNDNVLRAVLSCQNLKQLNIYGCSRVTDKGFAGLQSHQSLETLHIDACSGLTPRVGNHFGKTIKKVYGDVEVLCGVPGFLCWRFMQIAGITHVVRDPAFLTEYHGGFNDYEDRIERVEFLSDDSNCPRTGTVVCGRSSIRTFKSLLLSI